MILMDKEELKDFNEEKYVWYACYGSNINLKRFMYYITGDANRKYSSVRGCKDKSKPLEERQYIFNCPIYFAGESKRWGGGGVAFLDYEHKGKSYGKIYKIKLSQFRGVLRQESSYSLYDATLLVDTIDNLPVFTFTSKHKLNELLNQPSQKYVKVIEKGLLDLYKELKPEDIKEYLKN